MRLLTISCVVSFISAVNAHFQLQYPPPRGAFVEDNEPSFCDGYLQVSNRTLFPLSGGIINLNSEHPMWSAGVLLTTVQNPTSFDNFSSNGNQQLAVPFFQQQGEGKFCFPINIGSSGISGVQDGANVTIQILFNGGDGNLYQCADLTLSSKATIPSNGTSGCTNVTSASATSTSPASTATKTGGALRGVTGMEGVFNAFLIVTGIAVTIL